MEQQQEEKQVHLAAPAEQRATVSNAEVQEALVHIGGLVAYAYEQGFHELGYDPVAVIREAVAARIDRRPTVAHEFYNPATGHAIVDYTEHTHVGHLTAGEGYVSRPLVYAAVEAKDCPHAAPFRFCETCKVLPCPIGLGRQ